MKKEFIPYEQALALKELGFNEPCIAIYSNANPKTGLYTLNKYRLKLIKQASQKDKGVRAPLYQQAFRFFRDKYDLQYNIVWNKFYDKTPYQYEVRPTWRDEPLRPYGTSGMCITYEEAELACLTKLIEMAH